MADTITRKIELVITGKNLSTPALKSFGSTLKDIGKIAAGVLGAMGIQSLARGAAKAITGLAQRSADVMDVGVAFENLAHSIGIASKQWLSDLREASMGTISDLDLMKTANEAVLLTGKFMARDLPQYLKIAQVAARASGKDMKFLFDSLVRGVARGQPLIIDNALITLDAASAYQTYADTIGKSVADLNKFDTQMATHEAVLRAGQRMMEKVGDAGATLSMQFQQLRVKGENWANAIATKMAPALSVLMDYLLKTADTAEQAGRAFIDKWGAQLNKAAENALRWGVNIVTQLATGMVQGASQALIWAMNTIGNLLTGWLAPGSPPKVAPNIDKWGMAAMDEYLRGMTNADVGVLSDFAGPLKSALSAMVAMGQLGQEQMGKMFAGLSVDVAAVIDQFARTGTVGGAVFDKLNKLGGVFGGHLAKMLRGQLDVLAATKALKTAQDRLNAARTKEDDATDAIKKLKQEYFELRKAGASDAQLKAKFAEIKAAQQGLQQARKETAEAEKAQDAAQKKLDPLQEQVDVQRQILDQLAQMAQMQAQPTLAGGKTKAPGGLGAIELPQIDAEPFVGNLQKTFEDAKKRIQETLKDIFAPLVTAWETKMKPAIDAVILKWGEFKAVVDTFWTSPAVQGIVGWFKELFPEGTLERLGNWIAKGILLALAFNLIAVAIGALTSPIVLLGIALSILAGLWEGHNEQLMETIRQLGILSAVALVKASVAATNLWKILQFKVLQILTTVSSFLRDTALGAWNNITTAIDNLKSAAQRFWDWLSSHVFNFKINLPKLPDWATPGSPLPIHTAWKQFAQDMRGMKADFPVAGGLAPGAFGGGMPMPAGAGAGSITVIVEGNVLDDRMAARIADQIARVQRMRGVKRYD